MVLLALKWSLTDVANSLLTNFANRSGPDILITSWEPQPEGHQCQSQPSQSLPLHFEGAVLQWLQTPHWSWSWVHQCCSPWLHPLCSWGVPTGDTIARVPDKVKDLGTIKISWFSAFRRALTDYCRPFKSRDVSPWNPSTTFGKPCAWVQMKILNWDFWEEGKTAHQYFRLISAKKSKQQRVECVEA